VLGGHVVHSASPGTSLYVLTAHGAQGPPAGPVVPGSHSGFGPARKGPSFNTVFFFGKTKVRFQHAHTRVHAGFLCTRL
jgi:hypothetical protein